MELIPDSIDFSAYRDEPETHKVRPASEFVNDTIQAFYPPPDSRANPRPLWDKALGKLEFRPGEVSLWAGINGHGKSMMLSQVTLDLIKQGERVLVLSFEMRPVRQMLRMSRQAHASAEPPIPFLRDFHRWTDGKLWMYDHTGSIHWEKVLGVMRYAQEQFGVTQFVVDSLMKCVRGDDDYNAQKDFVNELCVFTQGRQVHVHLVHHVRKGDSEDKVPGKFDVKGAGAIADQVDNAFIVWRNKKAEKDDPTKPSAMLKCDKQRNGDWEGQLGFWFDADSMQYLERPNCLPIRYELSSVGQSDIGPNLR